MLGADHFTFGVLLGFFFEKILLPKSRGEKNLSQMILRKTIFVVFESEKIVCSRISLYVQKNPIHAKKFIFSLTGDREFVPVLCRKKLLLCNYKEKKP